MLRRLHQKWEAQAKQSRIEKRADISKYPLSYAQQRMWFLDRYEPESPPYNSPLLMAAEGNVRIEAVGQATAEIRRRHQEKNES